MAQPNGAEAIIEATSLLRVSATSPPAPTLAILSPYSQQVNRLDSAIRDAQGTKLRDLASFSSPTHGRGLCHTVDSFQGSEADVVFVSLVRNNEHSNIHNALGFLTDARRMNVLLSRAKWQLILVGSLDFLTEIVAAAKTIEDKTMLSFLAELLSSLNEGMDRGVVARVPFRTLVNTPA